MHQSCMQTIIMAKLPRGQMDNAKIFIWPFCALFIHHDEMQEEPEMSHVCAESTPGIHEEKTVTLFADAEIWLMLMFMLKCCERKILFHG